MTGRGSGTIGLAGLAAGYGAFYFLYSALARATVGGTLTGSPRSGVELLPATALGAMAGMVAFLVGSGMWRLARRRRVLGLSLPGASRETLLSATLAAVIILTTTLNLTFPGVSLLFMLLLMRGGVLVIAPLVDRLRRRTVQRASWVALALSLAAVASALTDVSSYALSLAPALGLAAYLASYVGRFQLMERHAKSADPATTLRYFVEEQLLATPLQVGLLAVAALLGRGQAAVALQHGFMGFLASDAAVPAFFVGLLYEGLFVFGSLIYLHPREYTYCVPINRASSLLAGAAASYALAWLAGLAPPSAAQLLACGLVLLAMAVLAWPALAPARAPAQAPLWLFVCSGNTCRSPMAEAIARAELAQRLRRLPLVEFLSAGLAPRTGEPLTPEATVALRELGVPPGRHRARPLSLDLLQRAQAIYCMTAKQRAEVLRLAPEVAGKTSCLDPDGDIPDPIGSALEAYTTCARRIQVLVQGRLAVLAGGS